MSVVWINKPIGWTPKDCIVEYQKQNNITTKIAFAGRLDPMAHGLLPLIIHEGDVKKVQEIKENLQGSYKTYQFKIIMGLESDSYDILGLVKKRMIVDDLDLNKVKDLKVQEFPPYSSQKAFSERYNKRVPLWKMAKEGEVPKEIPKREINVENIFVLGKEEVSNDDILKTVKDRIKLLRDNTFRNEEIVLCWDQLMGKPCTFTVYHLEARVSTGTYIRSICNLLGGVAYDIYRTSIGNKMLNAL